MKISVALCTYNGAHYLPAQLASIACQIRLPDELVVCDDGSSDNTVVLLSAFSKTVPFPVNVIKNDLRLGTARNFGKAISLCDGDIITLADQDDVWHPNKLACIYKVFCASPEVGLVFSNGKLIDGLGAPLEQTLWQSANFSRLEKFAMQRGMAFDVELRRNVITGATVAFRAYWKQLVLPIPASGWVHDHWIALLIAAVSPVKFIDKALIEYRCHSTQQLGLTGKRSFAELWRRTKALSDPDIYCRAAINYVRIQQRIQHHKTKEHDYHNVLQKLDKKIVHLRLRGSLPTSRWSRLPIIWKELINLGYFRYSLGIPSSIMDFFAPPPSSRLP